MATIGTDSTESLRSEVESVYRDEHPRLWRALYGYAGDREIASDAVAETFAQALGRGDNIRDLRAWLWRSAFAVCRGMLLDRNRRNRQASLGARPETGADPDEIVGLIELLSQLALADRELIVLRFVAGFSAAEIAQQYNETAGTIRVRLHRAKRRLDQLLEVCDD